MIESLMTSLQEWNKTHDDRVKMQHVLVVTAILLVVIAGLAGLMNHSAGQTILYVAGLVFLVVFVNAVAWALVNTFVLPKIKKQPSKTVRKK